MENGGAGWRSWNLARWNEVLVDRVFTKRSETSSEIVRLDATPQLLISVVEVAAHDDQTVRDCFLNSFPKTRSGFAELFDFASQTRNWRHKDGGLPFFAQLYLTILVASADEETFTIGNFRDRLQKILGLDLAVGHTLHDLPKFWKAAARWTRETGRENIRRLVLPAPERNEVIIGHSKLLAFPSFSDQTKLAKLLAEDNLDSRSPEGSVVRVVAQSRNRFSRRFGEEFDNFLRLIGRGDRIGAIRSLFWGAIVEINWDARTKELRKREAEFQLELDPGDPYTSYLMLVAGEEFKPNKSWSLRELAFPSAGMKYQIVPSDSSELLLAFLQSPAGSRLLAGTHILDWLLRGWIGFIRDDEERWVASSDLFSSNGLWLLIQNDRWPRVDRALKSAKRSPDYLVEGVLSSNWVLSGPFKNNPGLREILQEALGDKDSFSPRLCPPRIRLINALRLPEGILLIGPYLPLVIAEGAAKVSWLTVASGEGSAPRWLQDRTDQPNAFQFNTADIAGLAQTGQIKFRSYDANNEEIDATSIYFVRGCLAHELKRPSNLSSFLRAGDQGQLVSADELPPNVNSGVTARRKWEFLPIVEDHRSKERTEPISVEELPSGWDHCLEILTALFVRRAYITAKEIFNVVSAIWNLSPSATWARVNDLVENGFVEQLYHRRWSGSVFVGRPPQCSVGATAKASILRVTGIMPGSARRKLSRIVEELSGSCRILASGDRTILGAMEITVGTDEIASTILEQCQLNSINVSSELAFPTWTELLEKEPDLLPRSQPELWCSKQGRFRAHEEVDKAPVMLVRWDLERAQALYRLTYEGTCWTTRSRVWALLAYSAVSGTPIGAISPDGSLHLRPYLSLPLGFSQRVLHRGAGICLRDSDGVRVYPSSPQWKYKVALSAWLAKPASCLQSVALSRYREALKLRARAGASKKLARISRVR
jgi:hypothetical protein